MDGYNTIELQKEMLQKNASQFAIWLWIIIEGYVIVGWL